MGSPIYTKTGDRGKTSLGSGERVWKSAPRVEAYGTVDELNAVLGEIAAGIDAGRKKYKRLFSKILGDVQNDLFAVQSHLSNPEQTQLISKLPKHTLTLEHEIDAMTKKLPPITNFILPGGGRVGSLFHRARTVARRAERRIIEVLQKEEVDQKVVQYVNRLSDLFFTMARFAAINDKKKETVWSKSRYLTKVSG